jgi:hypothetical protein
MDCSGHLVVAIRFLAHVLFTQDDKPIPLPHLVPQLNASVILYML